MCRKIFRFMPLVLVVFLACSGNNENERVFTGIVEGTTVQVPALTGGKIDALFIDTGDRIQKGDTIAVIDTVELHLKRRQLESTLQETDIQEQIAKTNLQRAQNDLDYIQQRYQRFKDLLEKNSVPQQTVDDLENKLSSAKAGFETAQSQYRSVTAKKTQAQAEYDLLKKKISDAVIDSPQGGIVSAKYYEEGEAIAPMTPIAEVIDLDEVWVKVYVAETLLPQLKVNQEARIFPDGYDGSLTGRISWISPEAEFTPKTIMTPETRTSLVYAVKITIANKEQVLKQGMPVEIHL